MNHAGFTRGIPERPSIANSSTRPSVINDGTDLVSDQTLGFLLKGIFGNEEATSAAQQLVEDDARDKSFTDICRLLEERLDRVRKVKLRHEMKQALVLQRQITAENESAYPTAARKNEHAVFWPDPTDARNGRSLYNEFLFAEASPLIDKKTAIVSAGSCFATEISHALQRAGYNYIVKEQNRCPLGRVDEFDQAETCGETDDGSEVSRGLFAA